MSSPSASPSLRRSSRIFAHPSRYDEEQLSLQIQEQEERELHQALQESLELDDDESTDEEPPASEQDTDEEEEEKEELVDGGWTTAVHGIVFRPFSTPFGALGLSSSVQSPLDFFLIFLPLHLVQHMSVCTNEYAASKNVSNWTPTNESELYCFIGLLVYMGLSSTTANVLVFSI
jgi:hypothetical protein